MHPYIGKNKNKITWELAACTSPYICAKRHKMFSYCNLVVIHWSESELQEQGKEARGSQSHFPVLQTLRDFMRPNKTFFFIHSIISAINMRLGTALRMHITGKKSKTGRNHQPRRKCISSSRTLIQPKLSTVDLA